MQNDRPVSAALRAETDRSKSGLLFLTFVTITHPQLARIVRVVCEGDGNVSYANGRVVNYNLNGDLYEGVPFGLTFLSDGDGPAEAYAKIPAFNQEIVSDIRTLRISPWLTMRTYRESEWDVLYDENNARSPLGTPTLEQEAKYLRLRDVEGNKLVIQGRVTRFDIGKEPCPPTRILERNCPGAFM